MEQLAELNSIYAPRTRQPNYASRPMSDYELLQAYISGSQEAFTQIVDRHSAMVLAATQRILVDRAGAEDAAQAVFLLLVRKAPMLSPGTILAGWLYQSAIGIALNERKRRLRRKLHENQVPVPATADSQASWEDVRPEIDAALQKLPAAQRDAIVVCYLNGTSRAQAAAELGCNEKTLNSRVALALSKLRDYLTARGICLPESTLAIYLGAQAAPAAAAFKAGVATACLGKGAAATGALGMMEGFMKAMLWYKIKLAACTAVLLAGIALVTPVVYRGLSAEKHPFGLAPVVETADEKQAAPAVPKTFIPKGGKVVARFNLPNPALSWKLQWSHDGKRVLIPCIDKAANRVDTYLALVDSGKLELIDSAPQPHRPAAFLSGNKILLQNNDGYLIVSPDGKTRTPVKPPRDTAGLLFGARISQDGMFFIGEELRDKNRIATGIFVANCTDARMREIELPDDLAQRANADRRRNVTTSWKSTGQIKVVEYWVSSRPGPQTVFSTKHWIYDAATGKLAKAEADPENLLQPGRPFIDTLKSEAEVTWALPDNRRLKIIAAAPPLGKALPPEPAAKPIHPGAQAGVAPGEAPNQKSRNSGAAESIEILDDTGKVLKQSALNQADLGKANLWPRAVSADGRYLLATTYDSLTWEAGAPHGVFTPVRISDVLLDLDEGKVIKKEALGRVRIPRISYAPLVMSPSREILVIDSTAWIAGEQESRANANHGIWSISFDARAEKNFAAELGLENKWDAKVYHPDQATVRHAAHDRCAIVVRPATFEKAPGPRHIFVCYNSATPIVAFTSDGIEDEPKNISWSPEGNLLGFVSAESLYVWQPTEEPNAPAAGKRQADF
jgi:RNA polymerase sigma factor (sigma-70 family)